MPIEPRQYFQEEIDRLIGCPKIVSDPPKREMKLEGAHFRSDIRLESASSEEQFRVFMRRNADFPENFSIGLVFTPKDGTGEITLLRCNGPHGSFNGHFDAAHSHSDFHVHRASPEMVEAGLRPEKAAAVSLDFASYEEALQYFLKTVNVTDAMTHFPDLAQRKFPFAEEDSEP